MGTSTNYGGYFFAGGSSGRGVHGESSGSSGKGVYGKATGTNGEGLYGEATGSNGIGIYGEATATAATAIWASATGSFGIGVYSEGEGYDFYAGGPGINYGYSSSVRWKNNIRSIDDALGKVIKLRGVYFNWDEEHGGHHDVGMIAEEVGEILPEIVGYEENGIDATGMDYGKLTPLLVESIKELTKAVNQLKVDNNLMRQRVEALEAMIPQQKIKLIKESQ